MKDGLIFENDQLIYYKHGRPYHAGVVQVGDDIYYISSKGRAIKGKHAVHREMTNGILERGVYLFGDDYKLVPESHTEPERKKKRSRRSLKKRWEAWKKSETGRAWKKWFPIASVLVVFIGVYVLITVTGNVRNDRIQKSIEKDTALAVAVQEVEKKEEPIVMPTFEEKVLLCSEQAKQLYDHEISVETCAEKGDPYRPFEFVYDIGSRTGVLRISENRYMRNAKEYELPANRMSITIDNLKTGTIYYYTANVEGEEFSGSFETEQSTRFLKLPGLINARDIGGYVTQDGKTVKQGMIIRGTEIDGLSVTSYLLDAKDVDYVRDTFGFVYDFDLRGGSLFNGEYQSRLGEDVGHTFYNAPKYGEVMSAVYEYHLHEIFTDLANPAKYPMYMHGTYGADRTGTIVFLLQGVLNMSEEDMLREFHMTGFEFDAYATSTNMEIVIHGVQGYEGDTLQEKIVSFLTEGIGITEEQIQSIRNILLED